MRLLSRRALTERELRTKLGAAGYAYPEIRDTVAECRRRGFVNDEQFAADYAEILASRGLGGRRIRLALRQRGIPQPLQEQPRSAPAKRLNTSCGCSRGRPIRAKSGKRRSAFS